jgi:hypothetical protein
MTWSRAARQHFWRRSVLSLGILLTGTFAVDHASAETGKPAAESGVKGTVGLALLGAESVIAVEAAFGVQKWWLYAIGGGVGAVGGGVGGYFIDRAGNAPVSTSLLVGGLVFAVPTTIAMLSATAYKPPKNPEIDSARARERAEDAHYLARHQPIPSLVDVDEGGVIKLKMPAVAVEPVWSQSTRQMYSLPEATAVRVPVFHLTF